MEVDDDDNNTYLKQIKTRKKEGNKGESKKQMGKVDIA